MKIDPKNLPNDVEAMKALICNQFRSIETLEFRIHQLDDALKRYLNREYGRSADVVPNPNQRCLFNEAEETSDNSP